MSNNIQARQAEFMVAANQRIHTLTEIMRGRNIPDQAKLYFNLVEEETEEFDKAVQALLNAEYADEKLAALSDLLDGICDMIVVLMGTCNSLGLPFDAAFTEVHRSNMLKFNRKEDGTFEILKRADGKVIKPRDWKRPDIISVLKYNLINGY